MLLRGWPVTFVVCVVLIVGCQSQGDYTTTLSVTGGLKAGDPVIEDGRRIGTVDAVKSMPDGKSQVSFAIEAGHADEVLEDSIATVSIEGGQPALKLISPAGSTSRPAPPGSSIAGASTGAELALITAQGALKNLAADTTETLKNLNADLEGLNQSPAWEQFSHDLDDVRRQMAAAGARAAEILEKQLPRLRRELYNLETRLRVEGKSAEAQRLRLDLSRLIRSVAPSPAPSPKPN